MLHAPRHRRFASIAWLALLMALLQPVLGHAAYLHALHHAGRPHARASAAHPAALADARPGRCESDAAAATHDHRATAPVMHDAEAGIGAAEGGCDCRDCPALTAQDLVRTDAAWTPAIAIATASDVSAAVPPRVRRAHPCGLGSRGPPAAA